MIEVSGKAVYSELDELVAPSHTALLVIEEASPEPGEMVVRKYRSSGVHGPRRAVQRPLRRDRGGLRVAFASEGADVSLVDLAEPAAAAGVLAAGRGQQREALYVEADVSDEDSVRAMAQAALAVTPTAVMLASADGSHYAGQMLGPNGGDVML